LGVAVMLLLGQVFLQSVCATMEMGREYNARPRDGSRQLRGIFAGRAERAFHNLLENFPAFATLALALVVTGRSGAIGADVPLYFIQIPYARSLAWFVSILALVA